MKRLLAFALAITISAMTGCGASPTATPAPTPAAPASTAPAATPETPAAPSPSAVPSYEKPKFLSIGTAGSGGGYYTVGIAMSEIISTQLGIQTTAQITGGAIENNTLIEDGTLDFALTQASMAYAAVNGTTPYTTKSEKLSGMFTGITNGVFQIVTLKKTGISKMSDLKGKRVAMGPAGGGTVNVANDVWGELGFNVDDVKATYISYTDAVSALSDGKCDAIAVQTSVPASALSELVAVEKDNVALVGLEPATLDAITQKYPYYAKIDIPKEAYNTSEGASTICLNNMLVCRKDLPDGLVYDMTKTLVENFQKVVDTNPAAKLFTVEKALEAMPIELHPGAALYFREIGILK